MKRKLMTDEDVDNMIRKRVARSQAKAQKQWDELQPLRDKLSRIMTQDKKSSEGETDMQKLVRQHIERRAF
jgi:hypothetical protein